MMLQKNKMGEGHWPEESSRIPVFSLLNNVFSLNFVNSHSTYFKKESRSSGGLTTWEYREISLILLSVSTSQKAEHTGKMAFLAFSFWKP